MPRRSGGRAPMRAPTRSSVPARTAPPPPPPMQQQPMMQQPKQPGMMANIASTAAGVAIGSTVGHVLSGAIMGGGSRGEEAAPAAAPEQQPQYGYQQPQYAQQQQPADGGVCGMQMKQFLECAQTQHDISLCSGFNEALRQCKTSNGMQV